MGVGCLIALAATHARAATYAVTSTDTSIDFVCGSHCSINDALYAARQNPGADEITIPAGVYASTTASVIDEVSDAGDLTITGAGIDATILVGDVASAQPTVDVEVDDTHLTLSNLSVRNAVRGIQAKVYGGGQITIDNCKVTENHTAIFVDGSPGDDDSDPEITIVNTTVSANGGVFGDLTPGIYGECGDDTFDLVIASSVIENNSGAEADADAPVLICAGRAVITNSQIRNNTGSYVGGIVLETALSLQLIDSVISGNVSADDIASAIYFSDSDVTISRTSIVGNIADTGVYGAVVSIANGDGSLTITESTIEGNQGLGGSGVYSEAPMTVSNSTIAGHSGCGLLFDNSGEPLAAVVNNSTIVGNGYAGLCGDFTVGNTLLAANDPGVNCADGTFASSGHNIDDAGDCGFAGPGDIANLSDVGLAPLGNYGGPTATYGLCTAAGIPHASCTGPSPALEAASPAIPGSGSGACEAIDQRGITRPVGARCDIGAVEDQCQGPDSDGDGLCDAVDSCTNVAGGQDISVKPKLAIGKINDGTPGNESLKLLGEFVLPMATSFASIDPLANGARVVIAHAGASSTFVDIALPAGGYGGSGTRGWTVNGAGSKWTFKDSTGSPINGITKMLIQDRSGKAPNQVKVLVKGKDGSYPAIPAELPLTAVVVLGGQSSSSAGECGEIAFGASECHTNGAETKVTCKH